MREIGHTPEGNAAGKRIRGRAQTVGGCRRKHNIETVAEHTEKRLERPEGKENSYGNTRGTVQQDHC